MPESRVADDLPFLQERPLSEEQRTRAVRTLLDQGFSIADIWSLAPSLLAEEPGAELTVVLPAGDEPKGPDPFG